MTKCPDRDQWQRFLDDSLVSSERELIAGHLDSCRSCQQTLDRMLEDQRAAKWRSWGEELYSKGVAGEADSTTPSPTHAPTPDFLSRLSQADIPMAEIESGDSVGVLPAVPGYEIECELGRGGMGVVYKARHTKLKRLVALKMILAGAHADHGELGRFRLEAEAIASLQHPNVVQIYEVGEHDGKPYISLEFVDGGSLDQKLAGTPLAAREAARLVETLAWAMQVAHQRGVIHRDLKPANVLLTRNGIPKITDFGLAKQLGHDSGQTRTGQIMGTPSYMAPEQASGDSKTIGAAADIYAVGAILYELLTGRPPFKSASVLDTLEQVRTEEPVSPTQLQPKTPRDLETVCLKCLAKAPAGRYATARDLAEDLRRYLADEPIHARPVGKMERTWRWCKRRPALAIAAATLWFAILGASSAGLWYVNDRAQRQAEETVRHAELEARRKQVNREALAATNESQTLLRSLHVRLADPLRAHELLSDIDRWVTELELAGAVWQRANRLAAANRDILDANLASQIEALGKQLQSDKDDFQLAKELDDIRFNAVLKIELPQLPQFSPDKSHTFSVNLSAAGSEYAAVLRRSGLDIQQGKNTAIPSRLRCDSFRHVLAAALDHWVMINDNGGITSRILDVSRRIDPNPWRDQLRNEKAWQDEKMLEKLAKAVDISQQSPQSLLLLANSCKKKEINSETLLRRAVDQFPRDIWLNIYLGEISTNLGERVGCYRTVLAVRPKSFIAHNNLGILFSQMNDLDGAAFHYTRAINVAPIFGPAHYSLGRTLEKKGDTKAAVLEFEKAIDINPNDAFAHLALGTIMVSAQNFEKALLHLRKGKQSGFQPKLTDGLLSRVHHEIGVKLHFKKERENAIIQFQEAVRLDPTYDVAHYSLANSLREKKSLDEAIVHYKKAISLNAEFAQAYCNLGLSLAELGEFSEALKNLEQGHKLGSLKPDWPYRSAEWIRQVRLHFTIEKKLPRMVLGNQGSVAEKLIAAEMCQRIKKRYLCATELYSRVFAVDPKLADNVMTGHRMNAARCAALAAAGKGIDIDIQEKTRLRKQALVWLRADLAAQANLLEKTPQVSAQIQAEMRAWQQDADLAGLRDEQELVKLPAGERDTLKNFWDDVDRLAKEARSKQTQTEHKGQLGGKDPPPGEFKVTLPKGKATLLFKKDDQLSADDPRDKVRNLCYHKSYNVTLHAGRIYVIDMVSEELDSYLRMEDADGTRLAQNDDGGGGLNARIIITAPRNGMYRIIATSGTPGTGHFSLTVQEFQPANEGQK